MLERFQISASAFKMTVSHDSKTKKINSLIRKTCNSFIFIDEDWWCDTQCIKNAGGKALVYSLRPNTILSMVTKQNSFHIWSISDHYVDRAEPKVWFFRAETYWSIEYESYLRFRIVLESLETLIYLKLIFLVLSVC